MLEAIGIDPSTAILSIACYRRVPPRSDPINASIAARPPAARVPTRALAQRPYCERLRKTEGNAPRTRERAARPTRDPAEPVAASHRDGAGRSHR